MNEIKTFFGSFFLIIGVFLLFGSLNFGLLSNDSPNSFGLAEDAVVISLIIGSALTVSGYFILKHRKNTLQREPSSTSDDVRHDTFEGQKFVGWVIICSGVGFIVYLWYSMLANLIAGPVIVESKVGTFVMISTAAYLIWTLVGYAVLKDAKRKESIQK